MLEIYKWSVLITAIFFTSFGGFAFYRNPKDSRSRMFALVSVAFALWSYSWFGLLNDPASEDRAVFFAKLLNLGAIFIPIFYLHWVQITLDMKGTFDKVFLFLGYLITTGFVFFSFSDLFISGVRSIGVFKYWPVAGPIYTIFILTNYLGFVLYSFIELVINYFRTNNDNKYTIGYLLLGSILGFGGGATNFPYMYGNDFLQPYGIFLVMASPFIFSYAAIQYKLFNIKIVTTQFFVGALNIVFIINLLISDQVSEIYLNSLFLGFVVVFSILLIKSVNREIEQREKIQVLADDLQKANLGQSNLIHFMNHQVKGKFGNAKNIFAELLTEDYGNMPADAIPLLQKGLEETNMGVDYVQSILHGASAENGTLPYEMTDMNFREMVESVFAKQKEFAEKKGLKISLDVDSGDYLMKGDETQLGEAVKNLIDNSVNYTMEGSIDVSLKASDKITMTIKDTGVGISAEDKTKLFKSGGRGAESLKINVNSTGYGLAFVKGVVEAHKGKVWAESEGRDKGSVFMLELPKN